MNKRSYGEDLRKRVLNYISRGGNKYEASKLFEVSRSTIYRWLELKRETGKLRPRKRQKFIAKKFEDKTLIEYLKKSPSATLLEMGNKFKVTPQAIFYRLEKLKITRKKNNTVL